MKIKHLVITAILATAIFGFACLPVGRVFTVQAQTDVSAMIAQLQAQIASLMAQLQALQTQQGTAQSWCHTFNANIKYEDNGSEVQALQTALSKEGLLVVGSQSASDNGPFYSFGDGTASAVVKFQAKYGIIQTGYVGPLTRAKLNTLYGCTAPSPIPTPIQGCSNLYWFDNTNNNQCQSQKQFCGAFMYYGLQTFANQQDCLSAFNLARGNCTPNWTCGWGPCVNGYQSQRPYDSNNCPPNPLALMPSVACSALVRACATTTQCTTDADCPQLTCASSVGSYAPTCIGASPIKCVDGKCVSNPVQVAEQVKCVFNGSQTEQKCYTATEGTSVYSGFGCSGNGACVVDIKGTRGDSIAWKSSCGGLAYTKMDGQSEYAQFECSSSQPAGIILFYGQGCPHCTNVDNYIAANNIAPKVNFTKLETFNNTSNADLMRNKAVICGLNSTAIGVPFLWDGSKCYVGDVDVINFFSKYVITQSPITVTFPNGGQTLQKGSTYSITWNPNKDNSNISQVYIKLRKGNDTYYGTEGMLSGTITNTGSFQWVVPATLPDGSDYAVRVIDAKGLTLDDSDNYFKIVGGTSSCPNIQCFTDNCPGNHLPDANGCVNCSTPCAFAKPSIINISPSSGPINSTVIITGSNFTSTGNQISQSCPATSSGSGANSVSSADGRTLTYTISSVPVQDGSSINYPLTCNISVTNTNGVSNSVPFTIVAPTTTNYSLNISSVAGIKSVYAPGEKISFSLKGVELSDGSPASSAEGFNVQAYICKNGDCNNYLTPNPASSYNGNYNPSTGLWDVSMTAPSDSVPAYSMKVTLYCSQSGSYCWNNYRGAGSIDSQVEKLFNFIVTATTQPTITSISPSPALIGSTIAVTGVNLCGFESDRNLVIENSDGQKGIIYGSSDSTCNLIKFTLAGSYCTTDTSYSGLSCPSYITITPGTYKIYDNTPSGESNKILFSIVAP